ncbi:hypothetical protein EG329_002879 [Mollisiaceae sp. DMI_Dod_QoI]|nr:hypothetical protein EG329_002879 [Helotiales sp. DMI_Dod_QoI]
MSPNERRPRKSSNSASAPRHTKPPSATAVTSRPKHNRNVFTSPYDNTSHSAAAADVLSPKSNSLNSLYNSTSHSHQHGSHPYQDTSLSNHNTPHYAHTAHTEGTTDSDMTPMQHFQQQPSPFPYYQQPANTPPTSSPYDTTYHSSAPLYTYARSRDYSTRAEAGSSAEDVYSRTQHQYQDVAEPHTASSYYGTWTQDDLSGVGQHFGDTDVGYGQVTYHYEHRDFEE